MLDRAYEIKQWLAGLLHLAVICFLIFPLASPAPMSQSSASMIDLYAQSRPSQASKNNLTSLTDDFMNNVWSRSPAAVGRRRRRRSFLPREAVPQEELDPVGGPVLGPVEYPMDKRGSDTDGFSLNSPQFHAYLADIRHNSASWQSPLRLSYGLLGTCFVRSSFQGHTICSKASLHPVLHADQLQNITFVNSTVYLASTPDEIAKAQTDTTAAQSFMGHLDDSMLPSGWGAVPSLNLTVLILMAILLAGTAMPLTLFYISKRHPMSRYSPTANPVTERLSIKYQQFHCLVLPVLLAAQFALTVVTRINVKQYVNAFNAANREIWLPSQIMLDTFASSIPQEIASHVPSQTGLQAQPGAGFDLYYTALATHLALVLMVYELYRDDTSRCRVRINHELNWSANAELNRSKAQQQGFSGLGQKGYYNYGDPLGPPTPLAIKRAREVEQSFAQYQQNHPERPQAARLVKLGKPSTWASKVGSKVRINAPRHRNTPDSLRRQGSLASDMTGSTLLDNRPGGPWVPGTASPRPRPDPLNLSLDLPPALSSSKDPWEKPEPRPPHGMFYSHTTLSMEDPDTPSPNPARRPESINNHHRSDGLGYFSADGDLASAQIRDEAYSQVEYRQADTNDGALTSPSSEDAAPSPSSINKSFAEKGCTPGHQIVVSRAKIPSTTSLASSLASRTTSASHSGDISRTPLATVPSDEGGVLLPSHASDETAPQHSQQASEVQASTQAQPQPRIQAQVGSKRNSQGRSSSPKMSLAPPSATSETTFGTLHSPWVADEGQHAMQMEVLRP